MQHVGVFFAVHAAGGAKAKRGNEDLFGCFSAPYRKSMRFLGGFVLAAMPFSQQNQKNGYVRNRRWSGGKMRSGRFLRRLFPLGSGVGLFLHRFCKKPAGNPVQEGGCVIRWAAFWRQFRNLWWVVFAQDVFVRMAGSPGFWRVFCHGWDRFLPVECARPRLAEAYFRSCMYARRFGRFGANLFHVKHRKPGRKP